MKHELIDNIDRHKKTLLSLAKLHLIAEQKMGAGGADTIALVAQQLDAIEAELDLAMHQEQLPSAVLEALAVDANTMRVFTAQELIEVPLFHAIHLALISQPIAPHPPPHPPRPVVKTR